MPLSLIEANAYGIPFIASDCFSGPDDIVQNEINGVLYKEGSMQNFLKQLKYAILKFDENYDKDIIRETAKRFNPEVVLGKIIDILK